MMNCYQRKTASNCGFYQNHLKYSKWKFERSKNEKNKMVSLLMAISIVLISAVPAFAATYKDVEESNWAYSYVEKLSASGSISGYPDGTFRPYDTITAAELITIIVKEYAGVQSKTTDHWASGYVDYAIKAGLMDASDLPADEYDKPITRQRVAVLLIKAAETFYNEERISDTTTLKQLEGMIKDYNQACAYCQSYILQAYGKGMLSGYPGDLFKPEGTTMRAEAASMVMRLLDKSLRVDPFRTEGAIGEIANNLTPTVTFMESYTKLTPEEAIEKFALEIKVQGDGVFVVWAETGCLWTVINGKAALANKTGYLYSDGLKIKEADYLIAQEHVSSKVGYVFENPFK